MILHGIFFYYFSINKKNSWQLPIFAYTIVGVKWLNFCVRDGNRCTPLAIVTKKILFWEIILWKLRYCVHQTPNLWLNPRSISTGQLKMSPFFHLQPINQIVFLGSYYLRMGKLISKLASRLDAFSGYPFQT